LDTLRFLYPFLWPYWRGYLSGLLLAPFATAAALSVPYLTGRAVAALEAPGEATASLSAILLWMLLWSLVRGGALFAVRYLMIGASRNMEFDLRNAVFRHLQSLDQLYFKHARTGDLMARITADVEGTRTIAGPVVMYSVNTALMLAAALPLMLSISWMLTLSIMFPLSLLTVAVRKIGPRVHETVYKAQETLSELSSTAQENFAGVRVIKAFAQEEHETARFEDVARRYRERNLRVSRLASWMYPIVGGVADLALISLLLVGGVLILTTDLRLSDVVTFSGYQAQLLWPMISIGWVVNQFHRGSTSVRRLKEVLSVEPRVKEPAEPILPPGGAVEGQLSIRGLTFGYGGDPVLRDIRIEAPRGKTVAIVGRTGSGKSTLVSLIPRILPPPDGTIFLDGVDVNRLPLGLLRRSIGFVPQESFLFSRTVGENISFGVEEPEPEEIYGVAQVTRFDKDIDQLPAGYEELVGERGVTLSGGQKQRAAISRALLIRPRLLILDDAFSSVDTHTEDEILENLRRATEGLTTVIVAHRISSIRHAHRIYVLDEGRVIEEGSHDELVRLGGAYAEMHRLQLLSEELERM
jgi:ATP-binding cassette subfamily B protein